MIELDAGLGWTRPVLGPAGRRHLGSGSDVACRPDETAGLMRRRTTELRGFFVAGETIFLNVDDRVVVTEPITPQALARLLDLNNEKGEKQ